jgi:riboflavin synthase
MFTGIVEELGVVVDVQAKGDSATLSVRAPVVSTDARHGASIAVNGVCLTVVGQRDDVLDFDVMAETLKRSVIGGLAPGERVNLERPVRVDGRLDGHVVQGHVDGSGVILDRRPGDGWETVRFAVPAPLARYLAEKGSVAVDGVSLTVTAVGPDWFEVGLIPETLRATTLGLKQPGAAVNLEVDILAKYLARLVEAP